MSNNMLAAWRGIRISRSLSSSLAATIENCQQVFNRIRLKLTNDIGKQIGKFRRTGIEARGVDADPRMRDPGKRYHFIGLIPNQVEERENPLDQMPGRPPTFAVFKSGEIGWRYADGLCHLLERDAALIA